MQEQNGVVPVKSFPGAIPSLAGELKEWRSTDYGSFRLYHIKKSDFYAVIPIALPDGESRCPERPHAGRDDEQR